MFKIKVKFTFCGIIWRWNYEKHMKILVTICSKNKKDSSGLLPARQRYVSDRINYCKDIALNHDIPFYILSSKYGLINSSYLIGNYDHLLEFSEIDNFVNIINKQIQSDKISEIDFYFKDREDWLPYIESLKLACNINKTKLNYYLM